MIQQLLDTVRDWPIKQKIGVAIGLVLAICFLDYSYIYSPRSDEMVRMQEDLTQQQATLEEKRLKVNARADEEKRIRDLQADVKRAEARLPEGREIADLLSNIAASARAVGLDLTLFRQKPEQYSDFYAEVPVQMEMRGTYHELAAFMDRVKRLDRIVNVADISLKKPRIEGEVVVLDASCTATTFRFLDEQERKQRAEALEKKKGGGAATPEKDA
jgi:type IV pilus assembly protein PilO